MTTTIVGINGATSTESVNVETLIRANFIEHKAPAMDANGRLVSVYKTAPATAVSPLFFTTSWEEQKVGGIYTMRLSGDITDDAGGATVVAKDTISARLIYQIGSIEPTATDLRSLLSALYALTYGSVTSGTPNTAVMARMRNRFTNLY